MKDILLIRHAKSSWSDPSLEDKKRPLNNRGKRDAPFMAAYIRECGLIPDILLSSPAKRAYSTAKHFHKEFESELSNFTKETDLYFGSESDWLYLINAVSEEHRCPAFFSHNPTITYFANSFQGDNFDNIPTCGVVHLKSTAQEWKDVDYGNTKIINHYFPKLVRLT